MSKNSLEILIIGTVWVEPNSSAAGSRMLQLIELFQKQNWQITFACSAQKNDNALDLKQRGINEVTIAINSSSFDEFITDLKPDVVLFDRFLTEEQFGWRVTENCPKALKILDTEDLHFLRKVRHQQLKKREQFTNEALLQSDETKREIASILRCDLSLIISTFEMDLLKNLFKIDESLLYYLPFLLDKIDESHEENWKFFEERNHFVFVGNFHHKPNVDAVLTLKNEVWPNIHKQLPNAELHIYGAYVNQQIQQLNSPKENFLIKGFAIDAQKVVCNAKVVLAPLRFGAGIKGKLTEAMLCGTPSVTTTIGAEGMYNALNWNGFIENDFVFFSEKASELYTNKDIWQQSQENGVEIINSIYDRELYEDDFILKMTSLIENLEQHRIQNFMGSLLNYETLQATKFMSKWIEAKNKN